MVLDQDSIVTFSKDTTPPVELRNFWPPEDGFVWSAGKWCEVAFEFQVDLARRGDSGELVLDLDAFRAPPGLEAQNVMIYLNGLRIGSRRIVKRTTAFFEFNPATLKRANVLVFDTPEAASPATFSGTDTRLLGLQMFSFQIRYYESASAAAA